MTISEDISEDNRYFLCGECGHVKRKTTRARYLDCDRCSEGQMKWVDEETTKITFGLFKLLYQDAVKNKVETFFAGEHELVVGYAKYLIQWLSSKQGIADSTVLDFKAMTEQVSK